ncbi:hypothetical protein BDN72DRAFT_897666 [Pluteus cervinus]|uniref:Uncharacterized protein n=1 Tax=Pluteus cervinus TaxID=181527 RepID=A0ACD3ASV4_9AGAR|nr:hypothetical protein BDN72DRAFT_897666 [Pluteus cervinus]
MAIGVHGWSHTTTSTYCPSSTPGSPYSEVTGISGQSGGGNGNSTGGGSTSGGVPQSVIQTTSGVSGAGFPGASSVGSVTPLPSDAASSGVVGIGGSAGPSGSGGVSGSSDSSSISSPSSASSTSPGGAAGTSAGSGADNAGSPQGALSSGGHHLSGGSIAGIVIGCILGAILLLLLLWWYLKQRSLKKAATIGKPIEEGVVEYGATRPSISQSGGATALVPPAGVGAGAAGAGGYRDSVASSSSTTPLTAATAGGSHTAGATAAVAGATAGATAGAATATNPKQKARENELRTRIQQAQARLTDMTSATAQVERQNMSNRERMEYDDEIEGLRKKVETMKRWLTSEYVFGVSDVVPVGYHD